MIFIIKLKFDYKLVCIMVSSIFYHFFLQVFEISDLEVLNFWIFSESAILDWFSTWHFKHATIAVHTHFQWNFYFLCRGGGG